MKMRTSIVLVLAVVSALCGQQAANASVAIEQNDWIVLSLYNDAVQFGDGGEFQATVYKPGTFNPANGNLAAGITLADQVLGTFYTFSPTRDTSLSPATHIGWTALL